MTPLAPHITAFLRERLPLERGASQHTCDTYAYAFRLLFEFASARLKIAPSALHIEQIDATLVLQFLEHLENERNNGPRTRNARLAAIKSFMSPACANATTKSGTTPKNCHPKNSKNKVIR